MKRFEELTNEEIYNLSDDEVNYFVDLECAYAGKPLSPPPLGDEPKKPSIEPDMELYGIGLYPSYYVRTEEEATVFLRGLKGVELWQTDYRDNVRVAKKVDGDCYQKAIQPQRVYSQELYDAHKVSLKKYELEAKEYKSAKESYDEAMDERREIVDWIFEKIEHVRDLYKKREKYMNAYNEYLRLSRGDEAIALSFFNKSYPDWRDDDLRLDGIRKVEQNGLYAVVGEPL